MTAATNDVLDRARQDAGLTHGELWLRYFQLGGMSTALRSRPSVTARLSRAITTMTSSLMPSTSDSSNWAVITRFPIPIRGRRSRGSHPLTVAREGSGIPAAHQNRIARGPPARVRGEAPVAIFRSRVKFGALDRLF